MSKAQIEKKAREMCRHSIVFTDVVDVLVATRGMQGRSTKAIARELGITAAQTQYRISKAQSSLGMRFRAEYRNGTTPVARRMLALTERIGIEFVETKIAPKFIPYAKVNVPRKVIPR